MLESGFLIGFSLGQLLWGPLGNRFGRHLPVAVGLVLFIIRSAGCALSDTATQMIVWRVVQVVGACSGVVLSRAMVRDLYEGNRAAQMLSTLITVMAVAPLIGPIVRGQILAFAGWRAIFWLLVVFGAATLTALFTIPETLPVNRRRKDSLLTSIRGYGAYSSTDAWSATPQWAGSFIPGSMPTSPGRRSPSSNITTSCRSFTASCSRSGSSVACWPMSLMRDWSRAWAAGVYCSRGAAGAAACGIVLLVTGTTGWGGLAGLAIPLFVFVSCSGLSVANSIGAALQDFPERAGSVSALVGALHYGCGIAGSAALSSLADGTPVPLAIVVALCGLGSLGCLGLLPRRNG